MSTRQDSPTDSGLPPWLEQRLPPGAKDWVHRLRPWFLPAGFVTGFTFDVLTLRRVDDIGDNVQLTLYLLLSATLLVFERRSWHGRRVPAVVIRHRTLLRVGLQILFGGLFGAYFIFYSQSATLGPSIVFCLILAGLMLANEAWFARLRPDVPLLAMWFFSAFSYLQFAVPTWTGHVGTASRVAAALLALLASAAVVVLIHRGPVVTQNETGAPSLRRSLLTNGAAWIGLLFVLGMLVRIGAVPPVPLALAHAGIFHEVERSGAEVELRYESAPFWPPWRRDDRVFRYHEGDRVFCFTAVFAPGGIDLRIAHVWEHWQDGQWVRTDRIPWSMEGGRDGGWRSWTAKRNVTPGDWRVRVVAGNGMELGRVRFDIVEAHGDRRPLRTRTY